MRWSFDHKRSSSPSPSSASSPVPSNKASAKNAVRTTLILLERAADASNIPALKGSIGTILEVIKIAEKRQQNKQGLDQLLTYLRRLEDAIITPLLSKQTLGVSSDLEARIRRLANELVTLANDWRALRSSHRQFLSFINHEDYATEITRLNKLIKDSLEAFSLDNQIAGAIIVEDIHRAVKHLLSKEIQDLPRTSASYDSISRNDAPTCFEGTRVKVFVDLKNWMDDEDGPNSCALVGIAGVGKSTIAQTLSQLEAETGRLAATYFFSRDESERSKADLFFCTIAYQLAQHSEEFANRISEALRRSPDAPRKTLAEQLKKLIIEPLQDFRLSKSRPILIVLDALDECEENGAAQILQLLLDQLTFFKILITTRPEPHILAVLNSHNKHERLILHEVDNMIVEGDIRRYLEHQLSEKEMQKAVPGCEWQLEEKDLKALVDAAGHLFIVASTADKFIKDKIQRDPQHQLRVLLGGFGTEESVDLSPHTMLDQLYTQVLETAIPPSHSTGNIIQRFQNVVGTIIVLQNPLSSQALACLLGIGPKVVDAVIQRLQSVIVSSKGDDSPRMYHPSFPDFITTPSRCKQSRFLIQPSRHHGRVADHCFNLMKRMLKRNICGISLPDQYLENSEIPGVETLLNKHVPPELVYACCYWGVHLSKAEPKVEPLVTQLEIFAFQYLLFWLEVLALTGNLKFAYAALVLAQNYVVSHDASARVLPMLMDGQRFIMASQEIIKVSALHLYHSALPITPSEINLFQTYKAEATSSIKVLQGRRRQWDPLLAVLAGHLDQVLSVAFTSDGTTLASGSVDKTIRTWDGVTGAYIATLEGHSDMVWSVAFAPDGRRLASGSADMTVRLWDCRTGAVIVILGGHRNQVRCVAFAADGKRLASASRDKTIRLWDGVVGTHIATLEGHSDEVNSVAFSPNGQLASGSDDLTIILWDTETLSPIATLKSHSSWVRSIAFSPDGRRLASGSNDRTIKLWDVETHSVLATLEGHTNNVISVAFSRDGTRLASGSWDETVRLWDGGTGEHQVTLKGHSQGVHSVEFSPNGSRLGSASGDNTVRLWDCSIGTSIDAQQAHSDVVLALEITSDGSRIASASNDMTVKLWDMASGALISTLTDHSGEVYSVAFTLDGARLASGSQDSTVKLWNGATGELISTLLGHSDPVNSVAFAPDGWILASGSNDDNIKLWDGRTGALINSLHGHSGVICSVAFRADGAYLASGSSDDTIIIWNVANATRMLTLAGHSNTVFCVKFTSDGRCLASGSADKTIRLWDCATGDLLTTLEGHLADIYTLKFTPDGKYLTSQSADCDRRLWDVTDAAKVRPTSTQLDQPAADLSGTTIATSSPPLQLVKKNAFYAVLRAQNQNLSSQIPTYLLPTGSQVWDVVSTSTHIAVGMMNGEIYILDASQAQIG